LLDFCFSGSFFVLKGADLTFVYHACLSGIAHISEFKNMSTIGIVMSVAIPLSLIMLVAVIYNRRLQSRQTARNQARLVSQKADDILEALEYLMVVDDHRELQRAVLERVTEIYARAHKMAGDRSANMFDPEPYIEKIAANPPCRKVLKSDREIKLGRRHFSTILKTLVPMAKQKIISEAVMLDYRRHLKMALMERQVDSYMAQGDAAAGRSDPVSASSFYKAARKVLIEFDLQFPEKNERVKQIAEKTAALYKNDSENGEPTDALSKALSLEDTDKTNEFGISTDPDAQKKRY
jgi:hypothetical protein